MRFLRRADLAKAKVMNKTPTMTPPMQPSSIAEENFGSRHGVPPCVKSCNVASSPRTRKISLVSLSGLPYLLLLFNSIPNDLVAVDGCARLLHSHFHLLLHESAPAKALADVFPTVSIKSLCGPDTTSVRINRNAFRVIDGVGHVVRARRVSQRCGGHLDVDEELLPQLFLGRKDPVVGVELRGG